MKYNREIIEESLNSKGYKYFNGFSYDVNIVGIRNSKTRNKVTNNFDDTMTVSYRDDNGEWHYHEFDWNTLGGKYYE